MATTRRAPQTSAPGDGSRTVTITAANPGEAEEDSQPGPSTTEPQPPLRSVLKLRGGPRSRPQVQWTEDVVDNEGAGRKKSKICCIYHKPRPFDESSSEESSDSSDDDGCGDGEDSGCRHGHGHGHGRSRHNVPVRGAEGAADGTVGDVKFDRGPANAYEKGKGKPKVP